MTSHNYPDDFPEQLNSLIFDGYAGRDLDYILAGHYDKTDRTIRNWRREYEMEKGKEAEDEPQTEAIPAIVRPIYDTPDTPKWTMQSAQEALSFLHSQGIAVHLAKEKTSFEPQPNEEQEFEYKFASIGCTHLGSFHQQVTSLHRFIQYAYDQGVRDVYHSGDIIPGINVFRGQIFGLCRLGADDQEEYVIRYFPKLPGMNTYAILGNHDNDYLKSGGHNPLKAICQKRPDIHYLGVHQGVREVNGLRIMLQHGRGKSGKTDSLALQNYIDKIPVSELPDFLLLAHYHDKDSDMERKGVIGCYTGCFEGRNDFSNEIGGEPKIGGKIITVRYKIRNGRAVEKHRTIETCRYDEILNDY